MNFLYPGFLFALAAVAIPVIIHLFNFRKFKKVYFSNVAFLQELKEQNSSRENLKNLLILCCRILALVFLVFAFAQPYIPSKDAIDANKGNMVSIYLDNSYSMEAVNKEGNLLDEAKRRAKEIVRSFQLNDRFQLLTNDFEGKHQRLLNADAFLRALDDVKISPASKKLQQIIDRQQSILNGTSNRFIYVISDFQKGFADQKVQERPNTHISLVKLNANGLPNVAVDSVWFLAPTHQQNATEKLIVRIRNYGEEDAKDLSLKLTVNGTQKALGNLNVGAGTEKTDTLTFSGLDAGWQKAQVTIKDFPLTFDDELNMSFKVKSEQKILTINGARSGQYIAALFGADGYFKLTEMPESNINYAILNNFSLIVLNGLENPPNGLAQELKNYLENGGHLVLFPDIAGDQKAYAAFLSVLKLPSIANVVSTPVKVNHIEFKNPLFKEVFASLPEKIDLPQVNKFFQFDDRSTASKETILQLPANRSFFARYQVGKGSVYLAATDLDAANSNFAKHPIFVPLMYRIAFTSAKDQPIYYYIGKDNSIESEKINLGANQSLRLVTTGFEVIPEIRQTDGKTLLYVADQVKKAGFYDLKKGDSTIAVIVFNDDRTESDMHYSSESEIKKITSGKQVAVIDAKTDSIAAAVAISNSGTELWKLCLILTLICLAAEIALIKLYKTNHTQTHEASC